MYLAFSQTVYKLSKAIRNELDVFGIFVVDPEDQIVYRVCYISPASLKSLSIRFTCLLVKFFLN